MMTEEQQLAYYRKVAADVEAAETDVEKREVYKADAVRLAGAFRDASKTRIDAAVTCMSISRLAAVISITPAGTVADILDQCISVYAMAAGILAGDEEVNSQPDGEAEIDPADFPGAYL